LQLVSFLVGVKFVRNGYGVKDLVFGFDHIFQEFLGYNYGN